MDKKDKIIVWDQFEEVENKESIDGDSIPTFTRDYDQEKKRQHILGKKIKTFKPIVIAIFSALLIGSILGFLMLNILPNLNGNSDREVSSSQINLSEDNHSSSDQPNTLKNMSAYVLQVGVFTKKQNADDWISTYAQAGFDTALWEKENQLFLFAGIADTKDYANVLASEIKDYEFDVFIKEWDTKEMKVDVSASEYEWLIAFQDLWKETLQTVTKKEDLEVNRWDQLIEDAPKDSNQVKGLREQIINLFEDLQLEERGFKEQKFLLEIWQQFEKIFDQ